MWTFFLIFNAVSCLVNAVTYNTYYGVPATVEEIAEFTSKNIAHICTVTFNPCNKTEMRRPDGTCNNLKYPSYGAAHTPHWRMLPPIFGEKYEPRLTSFGDVFPNARHIRQLLVRVGTSIHQDLTTAGAYFIEFVANDIISIHDIENFVFRITHCCQPAGVNDYMCTPNKIPDRDYVHRFSHIRCNNNTRPISFQITGCVSKDSVPVRINFATTHFDLSMTYLFPGTSLNETRAFEGGRLKVEVVDGYSYASAADATTTCTIEAASKTNCRRKVPNALPGTNLFTTYFWRHHNMIADGLAAINSCWDDEKLFLVAMDINIACYSKILFYEYFALVLGRNYLIKDGILRDKPGFRNLYNKCIPPQLAMEFGYALRWFHGTQAGQQKLYDENDNYVKTHPMANFTLRVQDLPFDKTMLHLTHGLYNQATGGHDHTVDPEMSESGLGQYQDALDLLTADLAKGRYFGFQSYIKYRDFCSNYTIKHERFDDLRYIMKNSKIELFKMVYKNVADIELMAGIWAESFVKGSLVPPTVYCLIVAQLKRSLASDRHWFERPNRPNAFNQEQMDQVAKASLASLFCAVGNNVTRIQPEAFRRVGPGNRKISCDKIPKLDFSAWLDPTCRL